MKSYGGFVLAFNGGKIINYETGEIGNKTIPVELVPAVYEQACRLGVGVLTYKGNTIIHGNGVNEYSSIEAKINGMPMEEVDNFAEYVDYPVNKFLMTGEPEKDCKSTGCDAADPWRTIKHFPLRNRFLRNCSTIH